MNTMIEIGECLYSPLNNLLNEIGRKAGLPRHLEYYYINKDGKLAHTISAYHNDSEEEVVESDPDKVELAKALQYINEYFRKRPEGR